MQDNIFELQQANSPALSALNKERHMIYRQYTKMTKDIYDYAKMILDNIFKEGYSLPIDVKTLAHKLGFAISVEGFSEIERQYIKDGHDCLPISQLKMRKKLCENDSNKLGGTIYISNELNGFSVRFSIAQQLGHFALRDQSRIGMYLDPETIPGLYQLSNADEMLADTFAYALMLPYHLYEEERIKYESIRSNWPLDYADWIDHIRITAQIPEYHAALAFQEIKKINIYLKYKEAETFLYEKLRKLEIFSAEEQQLALELYAIIINNLNSLGYSKRQISTFLFEENNKGDAIYIVEYLQDYFISNNIIATTKRDNYPNELIKQIFNRLSAASTLSVDMISKITGISTDRISKDIPIRSLTQK